MGSKLRRAPWMLYWPSYFKYRVALFNTSKWSYFTNKVMLIYSLVLVYTQTGVKLHKAVLLYKKNCLAVSTELHILYTKGWQHTARRTALCLHDKPVKSTTRISQRLRYEWGGCVILWFLLHILAHYTLQHLLALSLNTSPYSGFVFQRTCVCSLQTRLIWPVLVATDILY